jgi:hypothetical protein
LSNGKVSIQYFDSANVVATPDFSDDIDTGDETDQTDNTVASDNNNTDQSSSDTSNDSDSDTTQDTSGRIVTSGSQAASLMAGATNNTSQLTGIDNGTNGYIIKDSNGDIQGTVLYNGDTMANNSPTISYNDNPNA